MTCRRKPAIINYNLVAHQRTLRHARPHIIPDFAHFDQRKFNPPHLRHLHHPHSLHLHSLSVVWGQERQVEELGLLLELEVLERQLELVLDLLRLEDDLV